MPPLFRRAPKRTREDLDSLEGTDDFYPVFPHLVATSLLLIALSAQPCGYYTFQRWTVFGVTAYSAYRCFKRDLSGWGWLFTVSALIFNPFLPVYLGKEVWKLVDLAMAGLLVAFLFVWSRIQQSQETASKEGG